MSDLKQIYEVLGLPEGSNKDEVERRYTLLLKRHRSHQTGDAAESAKGPAMEEITRAYKQFMELERQKEAAEISQKLYKKRKFLNMDAEKVDTFFYYYKWHIIVGIVVLIVLGSIVYGIIDNEREKAALAKLPPAESSIMFFGNYYELDLDNIAKDMQAAIPGWKRVVTGLTVNPTEVKSQYDIAMQQKSLITLMEDRSDIYIMDRNTYNSLVVQGLFVPLDGLMDGLKGKLPASMLISGKEEEKTKEQWYAIDVSKSPTLLMRNVYKSEMIAAITVRSKKVDNAVQLLEKLANEAAPQ